MKKGSHNSRYCSANTDVLTHFRSSRRMNSDGNIHLDNQTNFRHAGSFKHKKSAKKEQKSYRKYSNDLDDRPPHKTRQSQNYRQQSERNHSENRTFHEHKKRAKTYYSRTLIEPYPNGSGDGQTVSEAKCFKIVSKGNIIHDESGSPHSNSTTDSSNGCEELSFERFATSVSNIGPDSKQISLPTFLSSD